MHSALRPRLRVVALLGLLALALSMLVAPSSHAAPRGHYQWLTYGERRADLYVPPRLTKHPQIWILLHGAHQSVKDFEKYGFATMADKHEFLLVYPEGYKNVWAAGTCCFADKPNWPNEVSFINRVLNDVQHRYPQADPRIHVVGFSNGGMMAYTYACSQRQVVAVGGVAGAWADTSSCGRAGLRVHEIHSVPDAIVPYYGGYSPYTQSSFEAQGKLHTHFPRSSFSLHTVDEGGHDWPSFASSEMWAYLH